MHSANVSGLGKRSSFLSNVSWSPDDRQIVACFGGANPRIIHPKSKEVVRELRFERSDAPENGDVTAQPGSNGDELSEGYLSAWSNLVELIAIGKGKFVHVVDSENWRIYNTHSISMGVPESRACLKKLGSDPVLSRLPPMGSDKDQIARLDKYFSTIDVELKTLAWAPNGKTLSIGTQMGAYLWDSREDRITSSLRPDYCPGIVQSPVFSPDGQYLAAMFVPDVEVLGDLYYNFNRALRIARPALYVWSVASEKVMLQYQGDDLPQQGIGKLYWASDSRKLAWGFDNKVIVFDVWKQSSKVLLQTQDRKIDFLAWSPNGHDLAIHDSEEGIVIYDTTGGVRKGNYRDSLWGRFKNIGERVFAWSNAGDAMVVGSAEYAIDVWKIANE